MPKKEKEPPPLQKVRQCKELLGPLQVCQHSYHGGAEKKKREQVIENLFEKIMTETFSNLEKEKDIQVQEAQSPKQDEPKEAHTKTHHN